MRRFSIESISLISIFIAKLCSNIPVRFLHSTLLHLFDPSVNLISPSIRAFNAKLFASSFDDWLTFFHVECQQFHRFDKKKNTFWSRLSFVNDHRYRRFRNIVLTILLFQMFHLLIEHCGACEYHT